MNVFFTINLIYPWIDAHLNFKSFDRVLYDYIFILIHIRHKYNIEKEGFKCSSLNKLFKLASSRRFQNTKGTDARTADADGRKADQRSPYALPPRRQIISSTSPYSAEAVRIPRFVILLICCIDRKR